MMIALGSSGNHLCIQQGGQPLVQISFKPMTNLISINLDRGILAPNDAPLRYEYNFVPSTPGYPLHEPTAMRYRTSTFFYATAWEHPCRLGSLTGIVPKPMVASGSKASFSSVTNLKELVDASKLEGAFAK